MYITRAAVVLAPPLDQALHAAQRRGVVEEPEGLRQLLRGVLGGQLHREAAAEPAGHLLLRDRVRRVRRERRVMHRVDQAVQRMASRNK